MFEDEPVARRRRAYRCAVQPPLGGDALHELYVFFLHYQEHALLRLRQRYLPRGHPLFSQGDSVELYDDADAALCGHFAGGGCDTAGPHVLHADDHAKLDELQAAFDQQLLREGVADLDLRAAAFRLICQLHGCESGAADAVSARGGSDQDRHLSGCSRGGLDDAVQPHQAQTEGVYKGVFIVGRVVGRLASNRRHAHAVAVIADPPYDPVREPPRASCALSAEEQPVHGGGGSCAHRKYVPDYSPYARGRPLIWLDRGWVVMAFYLEGCTPTVSHVDDAGVLSGALDDALSLLWE